MVANIGPFQSSPQQVETIKSAGPADQDDFFLCAASGSRKCLGVAKRLSKYHTDSSIIIKSNSPRDVEGNVDELQGILSEKSRKVSILEFGEEDPLSTVRQLKEIIEEYGRGRLNSILLDVTSFRKKEMFLVLSLLRRMGILSLCRIFYTEPDNYIVKDKDYGIKDVSIVPTMKSTYKAHKDVCLVIFLGYEHERALAVRDNIEPNITYVVIPDPPYKEDWRGRTEKYNSSLISSLPKERVLRSHSREPSSTYSLLSTVLHNKHEKFNWFFSPLGTKLQAIGLFFYVVDHPKNTTVVSSSIYNPGRTEYTSRGIGRTWKILIG